MTGRGYDPGADIREFPEPASNGAAPEPPPWIDWSTFWNRPPSEPEWLIEGVLAIRRAHTIWAARKAGKSLLMLWLSLQIVRVGHVVVYLDWEMTEDDVHERLEDMGCGAETDLSALHYVLLPTLPPLNTPAGGVALAALVDRVQAEHPGRHLAVVIDTFSRAVCGEENSNDTARDFYAYSGIELKRRRMTYVRLDHAGHEGIHERGGSAKGDDIDVSWKLVENDGGLTLERTLTRVPWIPAKVTLTRLDEPLRYETTDQPWPAGTMACAAELDALGVPLDAPTTEALATLRRAGKGRRKTVVLAALRFRHTGMYRAGTAPGTALAEGGGNRSGAAP